MTSAAPPLPMSDVTQYSRLASRIIAEVQLAMIVQAMRDLGSYCGDQVPIDRAVVMLTVIRSDAKCRESGGSNVGAGPSYAPAESARGISVNAIASSLSRPFETMRRHVNQLIASGACERGVEGIIASPAFSSSPQLAALLRCLHDLVVRMVVYLKDHDVPLPKARQDLAYDAHATIETALNIVLAASEYLDPHYADWTEMLVINTAMAANARPITSSPALARRYAGQDDVPPDHERQPISAVQIAQSLDIPYSTVQRQVRRSLEDGRLSRAGRGVLVSRELLRSAPVRLVGPAATSRMARYIARLAPGGFRFDAPEQCYLDGPPPLLDFGQARGG